MEDKTQDLISKFNQGILTVAEEKELEKLIEQGSVSIDALTSLDKLHNQIIKMESPEPSLSLDDKFYDMLAGQRNASQNELSWWKKISMPEFLPKFAMAAAMLVIGLALGYNWRPASNIESATINELHDEVADLKEMMMFSLLEKESATDRLKAVSLTQEMDQASQKVTTALLQTLNEDENVNVRLAALDALKPYAKDSNIRQELIRSITLQKSPLVQLALAELMTELQEKSSVTELRKLLEDKRTPKDVRKKIKESIDVLI